MGGAVLNIIITHNGFPGVPNGFYRLTLMVRATPSDFQRVVATCNHVLAVIQTQEQFSLIYMTHNVAFETYHTHIYTVVFIVMLIAHLMVALQLNASPSLILQVAHTSRRQRLMPGWLPVIHPGGLLSIHSPLAF